MNRCPTHPGEMLREDFLPDYGLTASGFARAIGVSRRTVNDLLHERRGVSPRMALFLSRYFGNSPEFWLNAQRNVDLWDALQTNKKIINRIVPLDPPSPCLEGDPRFLKKVDAARKSLRSGKGIRLEDCMAMAMDEERRTMLPEWKEDLAKKDKKDNDKRKRLARECTKCDPREEKAMAEEGYMEKRAAKGSLRGFERAMKKVRDGKPGRKNAL